MATSLEPEIATRSQRWDASCALRCAEIANSPDPNNNNRNTHHTHTVTNFIPETLPGLPGTAGGQTAAGVPESP